MPGQRALAPKRGPKLLLGEATDGDKVRQVAGHVVDRNYVIVRSAGSATIQVGMIIQSLAGLHDPVADRFADTGDCHCVVPLIGAQVAINGIVRLCFGPLDALFPDLHQGRPLRAVSCSMVPTRSLLPGRRSCPREGSGRRRPG
jgi:hypothetical protein